MASRIVTSPAGEKIEVLPDEEWLATTGGTQAALKVWNGSKKRFIIAELWLGGKVEDPKTGRCSKLLLEAAQDRFPDEEFEYTSSALPTMMNTDVNNIAFERTTNGKRTFEIKLVALPEMWLERLTNMLEGMGVSRKDAPKKATTPKEPINSNHTEPIDQVSTSEALEEDRSDRIRDDEFDDMIREMELDAPTSYDIKPPLELSIASQVAMSLLTTVVEIITAGSSEGIDERVRKLQGELNDVMSKLAARLQENDTLRRQMRQAGDEIIALRTERDGLRSRLRATEANLTSALKGDAAAVINGEINRRVDEIMRVAPSTRKGDD